MSVGYDIELDENGRMPLYPRFVTGTPKIRQSLALALRTHEGEWLPDATRGLPFEAWINELWSTLQVIGGEIRQEMLSVPGVLDVTDFEISRSGATIRAAATVLTDGDQLEFGVTIENLDAPSGNLRALVWMHYDSRRFIG